MSSTETSNLMYLPYYMPDTNFNKVNYSNNLLKNGSILVTDPYDGIIDINQKFISNFKNNYTYQPNIQSTTWNIASVNNNNNSFIYFTGSSNNNVQTTKVGQTSIHNFNYNVIFGLTQADPAVIDWNYYGTNGTTLTDKIYSKIGPKLYFDTTQNYTTGNVSVNTTTTFNNVTANTNIKNNNQLSNAIGMTIYPVDPSLKSKTIAGSDTLYDVNTVWPYKVQTKETQYYNILTNGINESLLALPNIDVTTATQYLLTSKLNANTLEPEYSYTDLGDIIQNNYHYIVSYFDTRPTNIANNSINFSSLTSTLFNENLVQFMPLVNFTQELCSNVHYVATASNVASCLPISWTTTTPHTFPNTTVDDLQGLSPIRLEWGKNITIATEVNYTCANMKNLGDILTGWNYYGSAWSNPTTGNGARTNVPYINAGLVLYVPNTNTPAYQTLYKGTGGLYSNNVSTSNASSLIQADVKCQINDSGIINNYYVNIAGQNIILDVEPDPLNYYLPTVYDIKTDAGYTNAFYNDTVIDIGGIFYKIQLFQTSNTSFGQKFNELDIPEFIEQNFTATIGVTDQITINCTYDNTTSACSFFIANKLCTVVQSNGTWPVFTCGLYSYQISSYNETNKTVTITHKDLNGSTLTASINVFTVSNSNAVDYYKYQEIFEEGADQTGSVNVTIQNKIFNIYYTNNKGSLSFFFNDQLYTMSPSETIISSRFSLYSYDEEGERNYVYAFFRDPGSSSNKTNNYARYISWLKSFTNTQWWDTTFDTSDNNINKNYINNIYSQVSNAANIQFTNTTQQFNNQNHTNSSIQYIFSTMACLPFDIRASSPLIKYYDNHYIMSTTADMIGNGNYINNTEINTSIDTDTNFLGYTSEVGTGKFIVMSNNDIVKLVNTFSIPITNALNTTHNATDTMTFRFEKPDVDGITDYYYIIGIYVYITKGMDLTTMQENPHYIGFSPSTNVITTEILQNTDINGIPFFLNFSMVKNTQNLYSDNYTNSILMKDYFVTPSIFMSINESTGNNL